jgi:hypothetical protein
MVKNNDQFLSVRKPATGGLSTFDDPQDIQDTDSPEMLNIVLDGGIASTRPGSSLYLAKPAGETAEPLQTIKVKSSDGIEYVIAIYGNDFYLDANDTWVKINSTYTPASTNLIYGYVAWNNGRADDRLYVSNGTDNTARWTMALDTVKANTLTAATTLEVNDGTRFPTSGTLIINGTSGPFAKAFSGRTGNVFTLTGTLGQNVSAGAQVTMMLEEKSGMKKGKILTRHQRRLFTSNYYGGEVVTWYSETDNPEGYAGTGVVASGNFSLTDGNGEITGAGDFGEYLLISKRDSLHKFEFVYNDSLNAKLDKITPIVSGASMGPYSNSSSIKVLNKLYYPTETEGFFALDPKATGSQSSTGVDIISSGIQNYLTEKISYEKARVQNWKQKIYWAVSSDESVENNLVLVYDTIRKSWTKYNGWNVKDWFVKGNKLYYLDSIDGNIYLSHTGYTDNNNPYQTILYTKRYSFDQPADPKVLDKIYVEGYVNISSTFYVDVLFNEGGRLHTQTYEIKGSDDFVFKPNLLGLGQNMLGVIPLGWVALSDIGQLGIFRCYLSVSNSQGFYNIQLRFRSDKAGSQWGISGYSFNPTLEGVTPNLLAVSPEV